MYNDNRLINVYIFCKKEPIVSKYLKQKNV